MKTLLLITLFPLIVCSQSPNKKVVNVLGKQFILKYDNGKFQGLTTSSNDTIIKREDYFEQVKLIDFNKDGYKDLRIEYISNTAGDGCLYLFDKNRKTFRLLKNEDYPNPEFLKGKYFYSYHRSGCADLNWVSNLFKIVNFSAVKLASISGNGCGDKFDGIFIYQFHGETKILKRKFPISKINSYKNYKWGFIKSYWKENYSKFIN